MSRIFVIEDEEAINKLICTSLTVAGYETVPAYDGNEALAKLRDFERFDLALVDIMLPEVDGFALLPHLRERGIPVIYLTAKNDIESKVQGLKSGAEDYIVKPFEILELIVRMDKVLERTGGASKLLRAGDIELRTDERAVYRNGEALPLKPLEFELLTLFIKNKNIALSRAHNGGGVGRRLFRRKPHGGRACCSAKKKDGPYNSIPAQDRLSAGGLSG